MTNTFDLCENRLQEIEFYYSFMLELNAGNSLVSAVDNVKLLRIMKSNFLLMLYNFVEACIVSGMMEIYEDLKMSESSYEFLVDEIRTIWSNYEIGKVYNNSAGRTTYERKVEKLIKHVISNEPVVLCRDSLGISGNLDARKIKELCDRHKIRYVVAGDDGCLKIVKDKRNHLAHGDESFGDCARDMSIGDLEHIKDEVVRFIKAILDGMKSYYDNKGYLRVGQTSSRQSS